MEKLLRKYRDRSKYDLSCSESIIYAANEFYNLGLKDSHFKMMAPFSGGMYEGETCGILTGAISVLGILYTNENSHNSETLRELVLEYKNSFNEQFGSKLCTPLKESHRDEITGCDNLIIEGGKLLERIIEKHESSK